MINRRVAYDHENPSSTSQEVGSSRIKYNTYFAVLQPLLISEDIDGSSNGMHFSQKIGHVLINH